MFSVLNMCILDFKLMAWINHNSPGGPRNWETCLNRKLLFPPSLPSPHSLPYPQRTPVSLPLRPSFRDFIIRFKFSGHRLFLFSYISFILFTFPAHPVGFFFCFFTGFLAIFIVVSLSLNNNNKFWKNLFEICTILMRTKSLKRPSIVTN